jgi:predicted small integral membrane protein
MKPEMENELEKEIQQVLQGLPDLAAPPDLLARTMNALQQPAPRPRFSWNAWPVPVQIAFLTLALVLVAGLVVEWRAMAPGLLTEICRRLTPVTTSAVCGWNAFRALAGAMALAAQHLGLRFVLACFVAAAGACAICTGFGTIAVRLALARPAKSLL